MASCAAKHHAHKVGMGEARDTTLTGGGRYEGFGKFLQGGGEIYILYGSEMWVLLASMAKSI